METKQLALGDVIQAILKQLDLTIHDEELLASLNETKLSGTKGLELFYRMGHKPPVLPQVNAEEILQEVNEKEELFTKFWNMYDKKTGASKCKPRFMKLTLKEINHIFETLPYYIKFTPDVKFRKDPFTYLNQRTWEDEIYLPKVNQVRTTNVFKF